MRSMYLRLMDVLEIDFAVFGRDLRGTGWGAAAEQENDFLLLFPGPARPPGMLESRRAALQFL